MCLASDRQGSNFQSCVLRVVSSHSSNHTEEVLLVMFSQYVHNSGLKPHSFHFLSNVNVYSAGVCGLGWITTGVKCLQLSTLAMSEMQAVNYCANLQSNIINLQTEGDQTEFEAITDPMLRSAL